MTTEAKQLQRIQEILKEFPSDSQNIDCRVCVCRSNMARRIRELEEELKLEANPPFNKDLSVKQFP